MHLRQLELEHFRGAGRLQLPLHPQLNVFAGMNGAGKSSILDATAIMLSWFVNRIKHAGTSGRPIQEQDIQNGQPASLLRLSASHQGQDLEWTLAKVRKGHTSKNATSVFTSLNELARQFQAEITDGQGQVNLPLCAYYPVNRAVLDIPLRIREKHSFDLLSAFDEALTSGASFRTFFEWFREREDLENEQRRYVNQLIRPDDFQFPDPQLEAVRSAIGRFMPEFANLTVRRNPLRMEVEKNGKRLTVNQLSDGEKCLMAMIGDLARRMAIANPQRPNPLEGEGIVLIDEIDLHLHPRWQRMVVPRLLEVFPHCQFLITTHSPHVITHVQPDNLFLLSLSDAGLEYLRPSESYGKTVERVLEDLMGLDTTRPRGVDEELRAIYRQIDDGRLEQAVNAIEALKVQIGDDPDLTRALVLIKRKELIGR